MIEHAIMKPTPAVYSIPSDVSFVDQFAVGLQSRYGNDQLQFSDLVLLLPTRRAVRSLQDAFLRLTGGAPTLLPRMLPIGEIDDDPAEIGLFSGAQELLLPPAIEPLRRRLLLARLIETARPDLAAAQALELAGDLIGFLDQLQVANVDLDDLDGLVPADFAEHWQQTLLFLQTFKDPWQAILKAEGVLEPMARRELAIGGLLQEWKTQPPAHPVIAAGSTGSMPATAKLLDAVAHLPAGAVVLPGLDLALDGDSWRDLETDHPQYAMRELLARMKLNRGDVGSWLESDDDQGVKPRQQILSTAMQPSETTDRWHGFKAPSAAALAGLHRVDCQDPREEAAVVALLMRRQLETPEITAALVTPDRGLARRVARELSRWGIEVDDSAGHPLGETTVGAFLRLTAEACQNNASPLQVLAWLKHPLALAGGQAGELRGMARQWDKFALRGPRPAPGLAGMVAAIRGASKVSGDALDLFLRIVETAKDYEHALLGEQASLLDVLDLHLGLAEWLATDATGTCHLWAGDNGEATAAFIAMLRASAYDLPPFAGRDYPAVFSELIAGEVVRPRFGRHPRLHIWGPLEARLQHADLMILGGLNEGTWPRLPQTDPWLSRPMRKQLEMLAPEWRIGMSAHDFIQAASARQVVLTRSERVDGAPSVPSRWLLRLDQVLAVAGISVEPPPDTALRDWAGMLDQPDHIQACKPPEPKPPLVARPRRLSVSRIQTWMQNPYGLYASHILKLYPLDEIDADPTMADRGIAIHQAIERYALNYQDRPLVEAYEALLDDGRVAFGEMLTRPAVAAFWWPRFERIAAWFVAFDDYWRQDLNQSFVEQKGEMAIEVAGGSFILTATADRLDIRKDGRVEILDYKSGAVPTAKQVMLGEAPQLVLEALILSAGGFQNLTARQMSGIGYWKLSGGREPGKAIPLKLDIDAAIVDADAGLRRLITAFDDPKTPYRARPRPEIALRYDDYEHLARLKEWSQATAGDGGGDGA